MVERALFARSTQSCESRTCHSGCADYQRGAYRTHDIVSLRQRSAIVRAQFVPTGGAVPGIADFISRTTRATLGITRPVGRAGSRGVVHRPVDRDGERPPRPKPCRPASSRCRHRAAAPCRRCQSRWGHHSTPRFHREGLPCPHREPARNHQRRRQSPLPIRRSTRSAERRLRRKPPRNRPRAPRSRRGPQPPLSQAPPMPAPS